MKGTLSHSESHGRKTNMFKKVIVLVICALFVFSLTACSPDNYAPAGMKLITDSDIVDYKLYVPASWTADVSTGVVSAYVSSADHSNINVTAFELDDVNTTLAEYWAVYTEAFNSTFSDMEYETEGETILLSGAAAVKYVYTATVTGTQYKFMQVVSISNGTVYIFTYTSSPDNYSSHLEDIDKILSNFEFTH